MLLAQDSSNAKFIIESYIENTLVISGKTHRKTIALSPNEIISSWDVQKFQKLKAEHWQILIAKNPNLIILGTGVKQIFPSHAILQPLHEHKIGIEIMSTKAACKTFSILAAEQRDFIAVLFIDETK